MDMGVSGWRLDVADELSDVFLDEFRRAVHRYNGDGAVIGEVWEDATNKVAYGNRRKYLRGGQLDSVMNYPFRDAVIEYTRYGNSEKFRSVTEGIFRRYPMSASLSCMNFLGTHDTVRALTALAGVSSDGKSAAELKDIRLSPEERVMGERMLAFAYRIMTALPGAVCVFYGDEAGMEGYGDPFCRRTYPWGRESGALISAYREAGDARRRSSALRCGEYTVDTATPDLLILHRFTDTEDVICVFFRGEGVYSAEVPDGYEVLLPSPHGDKLHKFDSVFFTKHI